MTKWPELDTGRNSVKPWTIPRITDWKIVILKINKLTDL
jgi:hypothetical protein